MPHAQGNDRPRLPLLPFERELIHTLGITEDEYRRFAAEAAWRGRTRPAAYAHIPEVNGGFVVPILINLVIGIALSAVSALLAPKPASPSKQQQKQRQLSSRNGSDRFGTTSGFDSINELADYAAPIPIVFANREADIGGVMVSPQLVWSRCFSYGTEQGVKMMLVIGECGDDDGIDRPDLEGIFLGTMPLDAVWRQNFAFYWNRNTRINGRILAKNFAYGSRASASSGDLQGNDDIFLCPSRNALLDTAFSGAFSPSSNATFGCYAPLANGTGYRLNYRLVPMPDVEGAKHETTINSKLERVKIAGNWGDGSKDNMRSLGQKGVGREYSRLMGITAVNGQTFPGAPNDHKRTPQVSVGSRCTFTINGFVIDKNRYETEYDDEKYKANVDDINNATITMREQADDQLQLGTTVMIGRTVWKVVHRSVPVWGQGVVGSFKERGTQQIELECTEVFADSGPGLQIGWVSQHAVERRIRTDDQGQGLYKYDADYFKGLTIGPGFYPVMLVDFAVVRNTRPCDTTEFGLKSQVWNRANGLCNFASLPTPKELRNADNRGDSWQSGSMTTYFKRTSVFTIWLRPTGINPATGKDFDWRPLGEQFAIQGSAPVDQYNFLRITHPDRRQYEYRFIPKNGADLANHSPDSEIFWLLDARINAIDMTGARLYGEYSTSYGLFKLNAVGRYASKGELEFAPELTTGDQTDNQPSHVTAPSYIQRAELYPDIEGASAKATAVAFMALLPDGYAQGREAALCWELFGQASFMGLTATKTIKFPFPEDRWLELQFTGVVDKNFPADHPFFPGWRAWTLSTQIKVTGSSGNMNNNDLFGCVVPISPSNPRNPYGLPHTGVRVVVTETSALGSPGGRESSFEYELLGHAEKLPLGTTASKTFTLKNGSTSVDVRMTGTVDKGPKDWADYWKQTKAWEGVTYTPITGTTTGNWVAGTEALYTVPITPGNPFYKATATVGAYFRVNQVAQEVEVIGMNSDRIFEENGQITDLSNYTERTTSNENGPEHTIVYVNETVANDAGAPQYDNLTTCGLALRAGRNFQTMDQVRVWLKSGTWVPRLHPDDGGTAGPSNLFPDLVYFLLTDQQAGLGSTFSKDLIDTASFAKACRFLRANKLFFNGALANPQNVRDYLAQMAPYFLLNFVIANGRFALEPAIPVDAAGNISLGPVPISAMFTAGNIIEDTFRIDYLEADQRRDFLALLTWRLEHVNDFAEERTVSVFWNEAGGGGYPVETFNMADFCCSEEHAVLFGRFSLSVRRRVTHTVSFKTTPYGLNLAPGNYIRVATEASPYHAANNGVIAADGTVTSSGTITDGSYPIFYYDRISSDTKEGEMTVADGRVIEPALHDTLFTVKYAAASQGVYQVEQLTLDEDGLVEIVAAEHPVDEGLVSLIARDITNGANFSKDY